MTGGRASYEAVRDVYGYKTTRQNTELQSSPFFAQLETYRQYDLSRSRTPLEVEPDLIVIVDDSGSNHIAA